MRFTQHEFDEYIHTHTWEEIEKKNWWNVHSKEIWRDEFCASCWGYKESFFTDNYEEAKKIKDEVDGEIVYQKKF